jgi:hypothetical protein
MTEDSAGSVYHRDKELRIAIKLILASSMTKFHEVTHDVSGIVSSLGNQSVVGSYRYRSWQLQFWHTFLFFESMSYQFQCCLEDFYDYSWQLFT